MFKKNPTLSSLTCTPREPPTGSCSKPGTQGSLAPSRGAEAVPMPILRHGKPGGCNSSPSHRWSRSHPGSSQERWQGCSSRQKLTSPMLLPRCFPLLLDFWLSDSKHLIPRTSGSGLAPLRPSADPASPRCCPTAAPLPCCTPTAHILLPASPGFTPSLLQIHLSHLNSLCPSSRWILA